MEAIWRWLPGDYEILMALDSQKAGNYLPPNTAWMSAARATSWMTRMISMRSGRANGTAGPTSLQVSVWMTHTGVKEATVVKRYWLSSRTLNHPNRSHPFRRMWRRMDLISAAILNLDLKEMPLWRALETWHRSRR